MASIDPDAETLSEKGIAPKRKITSPSKLIGIAQRYAEHDRIASSARARQQALVDGEPPWLDKELREKGLSHIINTNFGEANAMMKAALAPYIELINSVPRLPNVILDDDDDMEDQEIVSDEFDRLLKEWPDFHTNIQLLAREFVGDGIGVAIWPDERTILWEPVGLNDFKIARDTKVGDESVGMAICNRTMSVSDLHACIRNPSAAKKIGWNVEAVKEAIWRASSQSYKWNNFTSHWEDFEKEVKENDLYAGEVSYNRVRLIISYNKEYDGNYTQLIASQDNQKFLYERPSKYGHVNQCFTMFTYGVGEGTFHSIRGLKYEMYSSIQISNRIISSAAQSALTSGLVQLQGDAKTIQNFRHIEVGPYSFIPAGLTPLNLTPNTSSQTLPVYQQLSRILQENTGSFRTRNLATEGKAISATEAQQKARNENTLSTAAMNLFYTPLDKLLTEQFRRILSPNLTQRDKGGELAMQFRRRCIKRGVSLDKVRKFHRVIASRAIGNGDPVMGEMATEQLIKLSSGFDEKGKSEALRAAVAGIKGVGYQKVSLFVPKAGSRKLVDFDIANLENDVLRQGRMPVITGEQNHMSHIEAHKPLMDEQIDAHRQQQVSDEDAMKVLGPTLEHTTAHVDALSTNAVRVREVNEMRKMLQESSAYILELQQQVINRMMAQKKQMEQGGEQGGGQGGGQGQVQPQQGDPKQQAELARLQKQIDLETIKGKNMQEKHQQEMDSIKQKMALADLVAKTSIASKSTGNPVGHPPLQP